MSDESMTAEATMVDDPQAPQAPEASGVPPLDEQVCYAIYSAGMAIQRAYKPVLDRLGLTYPQYLVLIVLWHSDGQTVGRIAEQLALEPSTLTPVLKRLEASGLVRRNRNPDDERQVVIVLTEAGRAMRDEARCLPATMLAVCGTGLDDLRRLNQDVRALRDRIYSQTGGWAPGLKSGLK